MARVTLDHIYKVYDNGVKAVNDFNIDIKDKEFIVFVGPSGCGKSTTLRMIAGLEKISAGDLYIDGVFENYLEPKDRDIAMVFQNYALYPHMTVYDNLAFSLKLKHMPKDEIKSIVLEAAKILDIEEYLDRKPKAMSGGQRQRVALGRAIVRNPKVFLLDEPLSNLDAKLRAEMRSEITRLYQKLGTTFIYVTHDQIEAMTMGTRIVVMKDGFVKQIDSPSNLYDYPTNKFVAGFIGSPQMNFMNVKLAENDDLVHVHIKDQVLLFKRSEFQKLDTRYLRNKKDIVLGIRSEDISAEPEVLAKNPHSNLKVVIQVKEELGAETLLYTSLKGDENTSEKSSESIVIRVSNKLKFVVGEEITVCLDPTRIHFFDSETELSIMPRIPEKNLVKIEIIDNKIKLFNSEIVLTDYFKELLEPYKSNTDLVLNIPTRNIFPGTRFKLPVVSSELIDDYYLLSLKAGTQIIFARVLSYNNETEWSFDLDYKALEIYDSDKKVLTSIPELNYLKGRITKHYVSKEINGKKKKIMSFFYLINNQELEIPLEIASRIVESSTKNLFKEDYTFAIPTSAIKLNENNGIKGKCESVVDLISEKFAYIKEGDSSLYVPFKGANKPHDIFLEIDLKQLQVINNRLGVRIA